MAGIIEHGAGIAAAGQALGAGAAGMVSGMQIATELQGEMARTEARRQQLALLQQAANLEETQRQAQQEWDSLQIAGGPGDMPLMRDMDDGQTAIPGAKARPTGLTEAEARIFPSLNAKARKQIVLLLDDDRALAHIEAMSENIKGRIALMESGQGPYEGADPEKAKLLLEQAQQIAEGVDAGLVTGADAHQRISMIHKTLAEMGRSAKENLATAAVLAQAWEIASQDPNGLGADEKQQEWVENVSDQYWNGEISGKVAQVLVGLGPDNSDAVASHFVGLAQRATMESQGRLTVQGTGARPGGAYAGDDLEAESDQMGGGGMPAVAPPASTSLGKGFEPESSIDVWAGPEYEMSPTLKVKESPTKTGAHRYRVMKLQVDGVLDLVGAIQAGSKKDASRLLDRMARNDRDRTIFTLMASDLAAELSSVDEHRSKSRTTGKKSYATPHYNKAKLAVIEAYKKQRDLIEKGPGEPTPQGARTGVEGQTEYSTEPGRAPQFKAKAKGERANLGKKKKAQHKLAPEGDPKGFLRALGDGQKEKK